MKTPARSIVYVVVARAALAIGVAGGALTSACGGASKSESKSPSVPAIAWIENDYATAIARARAEKKLVVAVVWTAWCSPCRTMRALTMRDAAIVARARDFVWLDVDAERDASTRFIEKHAPLTDALPSVSTIDPSTETVRATWRGSPTAPELLAMFRGGAGGARAETRDADALDDAELSDAQNARAHAPNAAARAAFDEVLLDAWRARNRPEEALGALEESARDLPRDYDVLARLAFAYRLSKRPSDAQRAIDRAAALAYGPRAVVVLAEKSAIERERGDDDAARKTLDSALELARSLPLTGQYARTRAALEVRRSEWKTRQKP